MMPASKQVKQLYDDAVNAAQQFAEYKYLFREEKLELLDAASSTFFQREQRRMVTQLVLYVSRVTDRHESRYQENLSIGKLLELSAGKQYQASLSSIVEEINELAIPIRSARNKIIAHRDLTTALSNSPIEVEGFLLLVGTIIDKVFQCLKYFFDEHPDEDFSDYESWMNPTYLVHIDKILELLQLALKFRIVERETIHIEEFWDIWHSTNDGGQESPN